MHSLGGLLLAFTCVAPRHIPRQVSGASHGLCVAFRSVLEEFDTYGEQEDYVTEIDSRADAYQVNCITACRVESVVSAR